MKHTICCLALLFSSVTLLAQTNFLVNGDFENGMENWTHLADGDGEATFSIETNDVHSGSNALRVHVVRAGTNAWDIQSIHSGWPSVQEQEYTLTFYAKSSSGSSLRIIQQNETYSDQDFALSSNWNEYTWTFTARENDLQLKIHYFQEGTFLIDQMAISSEGSSGDVISVSVNPAARFQEMVGFGGALTWHSDRITRSPHKEEIFSLLFEDLGIDILRLKNWYYPLNYPSEKSSETMEVEWFHPHFVAAGELFAEAKRRNPSIVVLLSSWGPPSSLKSNNNLAEGTLRKDNSNRFIYSEFAQYWVDLLDNIGFTPDYISIQNEPGFTTDGWTTCAWRPTETSDFPGFDTALDSVYNRIRSRPNAPGIIAPETENIGQAIWDNNINTFRSMSEPLSAKDYISAYAYHIYNFYNGPGSINTSLLNMVRDEFDQKPNWMTEFSSTNYDWLQSAYTIQLNLLEANTSAYIYWELMWDENSDQAMIAVDGNGDFQVQSLYYTVKHFSKHIRRGYRRIASSGSSSQFTISSFISPDNSSITHVLVNRSPLEQQITLSHAGVNVKGIDGYRSVQGQWYSALPSTDTQSTISFPGHSVTTLVVDLDTDLPIVPRSRHKHHSSPSGNADEWALYSARGVLVRKGTGVDISYDNLASGIYFLHIGKAQPKAVIIGSGISEGRKKNIRQNR